ncbi:MAG: hypothetical protein ACERKZ_20250 [Lachnotalea sp.]
MAETTDITIDPSVLKERTQAYSSLTDINGANVFTNTFEAKVKQYKDQINQSYGNVEEGVFIQSVDNTDIYEQVKSVMFSSSEIKVKKESYTNTSSATGFAIPIMGIAFVIVIIVMIRYVNKRRRKWREHDVNIYAYE